MFKRGKVVIAVFIISLFFMPELFSQAAVKAVKKDVIKAKPRTPMVFDTGRNFVDNSPKSRKVKAKIRIIHGSSCPSFVGYTSKARDKRIKMLHKKRR
jgi:hypothetical protein